MIEQQVESATAVITSLAQNGILSIHGPTFSSICQDFKHNKQFYLYFGVLTHKNTKNCSFLGFKTLMYFKGVQGKFWKSERTKTSFYTKKRSFFLSFLSFLLQQKKLKKKNSWPPPSANPGSASEFGVIWCYTYIFC